MFAEKFGPVSSKIVFRSKDSIIVPADELQEPAARRAGERAGERASGRAGGYRCRRGELVVMRCAARGDLVAMRCAARGDLVAVAGRCAVRDAVSWLRCNTLHGMRCAGRCAGTVAASWLQLHAQIQAPCF